MSEKETAEAAPDLQLLSTLTQMIELERSVTAKLEKAGPWLSTSTSSRDQFQKRVRPIPRTMDEVRRVLAVARSYSARTSAPAGWNPNAPVVGFCTPNPLPHQLRGGALAALQLRSARQVEQDKKRKREAQEEEEAAKRKAADEAAAKTAKAGDKPKNAAAVARPAASATARNRPSRPNQQRVITTTMNLSESSSSDSSEDGSDGDSDSEEEEA